ncbi:hypothetical protein ElyMa_001248000 [Elysia marginata]|uniref:Uncharacterized protein n=1 Tax=Elysia marginata TaxID=1093978 RepID=A0AAV4ID17_9GAST|nr:hypothetical protein ElyMa_001248000 [Elysia marginata]
MSCPSILMADGVGRGCVIGVEPASYFDGELRDSSDVVEGEGTSVEEAGFSSTRGTVTLARATRPWWPHKARPRSHDGPDAVSPCRLAPRAAAGE